MKNLKKLVAEGILASTAAAGVFISFSPTASAINTQTCGSRTDFFKVWYNNGASTACFANSGTSGMRLNNVTKITTGNNAGWYTSSSACLPFHKWETIGNGKTSMGYIEYISIS